ncbi:MAG: tripartite tricarboxylate transporter TctB family protein [Desulfovibrio sp.]|uniref:tripartite tricarboxylate transporter TctB family protein n=1 Tax=Desulfovibrio sp. 7SRBS1 TaxID=3378064 RepID=UPI003B3D31AF
MKQYVQDRYIAIGGLVLVVLGINICGDYPAESAFFPEACLIAIGLLLALLGIESVMTQRKLVLSGACPQEAMRMEWRAALVVTCTMALYVFLVGVLGFYVSSALLLVAVGLLWGGVKKRTVLLFAVCLLAFLYCCFSILFNVPLPTGIGM